MKQLLLRYMQTFSLYFCLMICLSIFLSVYSISLFLYISVRWFVCLSFYLSIASVSFSIFLSDDLFVYLFICPCLKDRTAKYDGVTILYIYRQTDRKIGNIVETAAQSRKKSEIRNEPLFSIYLYISRLEMLDRDGIVYIFTALNTVVRIRWFFSLVKPDPGPIHCLNNIV